MCTRSIPFHRKRSFRIFAQRQTVVCRTFIALLSIIPFNGRSSFCLRLQFAPHLFIFLVVVVSSLIEWNENTKNINENGKKYCELRKMRSELRTIADCAIPNSPMMKCVSRRARHKSNELGHIQPNKWNDLVCTVYSIRNCAEEQTHRIVCGWQCGGRAYVFVLAQTRNYIIYSWAHRTHTRTHRHRRRASDESTHGQIAAHQMRHSDAWCGWNERWRCTLYTFGCCAFACNQNWNFMRHERARGRVSDFLHININ